MRSICFICYRRGAFMGSLAARCAGRLWAMRRPCSTTRPCGCSGAGSAGSCPVIPSSSWYRWDYRRSCLPRSIAASWAGQNVNTIRTVGLTIIYLSLAVPIWRYESFGAWVTLLVCSLAGVFLGIGLRLQTFLWMGLTTFVLDVVYEMGRVSLDYAFAKWAIMLALGIVLVMFVALNEKKRIVEHDAALLRPGEAVGMMVYDRGGSPKEEQD